MEQTIIADHHVDPSYSAIIQSVGKIAHANGIDVYLVGGSVRDLFLDLPFVDLDITCNSDPSRLIAALANDLDVRVISTSRFGTSKVLLNGQTADLAMMRSDVYSQPGGPPSVSPSTIMEDLRRRDFSVNAMAINISPPNWGEFLDPTGGYSDLLIKELRALHPESFQDDAIRILRASRYSTRLGFTINGETWAWMHQDWHYMAGIDPNRLRNELLLFLEEPDPTLALIAAFDMNGLKGIHSAFGDPSLRLLFQGLSYRIESHKTLMALLIHGVPSGDMEEVARRLNISSRDLKFFDQIRLLPVSKLTSGSPDENLKI